jgi:hypothetical protein
MTRDEIRELAKEAGFNWGFIKEQGLIDGMIDFAKLVAQHEREACAKVVEVEAMQYAEPVWAIEIVNDILARGQA